MVIALMTEMNPEDAKIATLARAARSRVAAASGAAVRDTTGRTYSSANVAMGDLVLSAVVLAVAQAVAAGATGLEAVAVCGTAPSREDLAGVAAIGGPGVPVLVIGDDGSLAQTLAS